jgi:hypothetical protein
MGIVNKTIRYSFLASLLLQIALGTSSSAASASGGSVSYLYNLSNFTGVLPFTWVRVVPDSARNEVYVAEANTVYVFNDTGMEIYRFGDYEQLGSVFDVAALESGDLLLLGYKADGSGTALVRCDYRGEILERLPLAGIPDAWGAFRPTKMTLRGEKLYLVDFTGMKVAVLDRSGSLKEAIDLAANIKTSEKKTADFGIGGFDADDEGNIYFTVTTQFTAYRLSADRKVESFGQPGGAPGKFGVIAGIAADRSGNIFVVDTLKCVVMAFDRDFGFLEEFGYRTPAPGGLVAPREVAVSGNGRIYVTQQANRGVSVYRLSSN